MNPLDPYASDDEEQVGKNLNGFFITMAANLTEKEGSVQLPFFTKTIYLNEEVNCTEPSPSVRVPWL